MILHLVPTAFSRRGLDLSDWIPRVERTAPWTDESPYRSRELYRGDGGSEYRAAVSAAIRDHTWIAEQRRPR